MPKKDQEKPYHIPVLVDEVLQYLDLQPGGVYVDATFGGGGHTRALLKHEPKCTVIAMDWDLQALETNGPPVKEAFPDRLTLIWGNFTAIDKKFQKKGLGPVDGILADFGTSFHQLTERPGFSFYKDSPLDMRMSPAHQRITAVQLLQKLSEQKLAQLFIDYGHEPKARAIARAIVQERKKKRITTTKQLSAIVERVVGPKLGKRLHPATKVFQALRIHVNKELENIAAFLPAALRVLKPGGRLACISFHSLEDGIVKQFFKARSSGVDVVATVLTSKPVVPTQEEIAANSACRSAKLRVLQMRTKGV